MIENTPPKSPRARLLLGVLRTMVLAFILGWVSMLIYKKVTEPKQFLGNPVLYSNEYKSVVEVHHVAPKRALFTNCAKEKASIVFTQDTLVLHGPRGSVGFKPLQVGADTGLVCIRQDGELVSFYRIVPNGLEKTLENTCLVLVQPEGILIFNPKGECITADDLK